MKKKRGRRKKKSWRRKMMQLLRTIKKKRKKVYPLFFDHCTLCTTIHAPIIIQVTHDLSSSDPSYACVSEFVAQILN
jgi:hypothetical protein